MKIVALAAAASLALSVAALAQTPAPAPRAPATPTTPATPAPSATTPADTTGSTARAAVNSAPLENGSNSFTEQQAMMRLRDAGITDVTGLAKDNNGIWRGRGMWQGKSVTVGLDFRGHISAQ